MLPTLFSLVPTKTNIENLAADILLGITAADPTTNQTIDPCLAYAKVCALQEACEMALTDLGARATAFCVQEGLGSDGKNFQYENMVFRRHMVPLYDLSRYDTAHVCSELQSQIDENYKQIKILNGQLKLERKKILMEHPKIQPVRIPESFTFVKAVGE